METPNEIRNPRVERFDSGENNGIKLQAPGKNKTIFSAVQIFNLQYPFPIEWTTHELAERLKGPILTDGQTIEVEGIHIVAPVVVGDGRFPAIFIASTGAGGSIVVEIRLSQLHQISTRAIKIL